MDSVPLVMWQEITQQTQLAIGRKLKEYIAATPPSRQSCLRGDAAVDA